MQRMMNARNHRARRLLRRGGCRGEAVFVSVTVCTSRKAEKRTDYYYAFRGKFEWNFAREQRATRPRGFERFKRRDAGIAEKMKERGRRIHHCRASAPRGLCHSSLSLRMTRAFTN